MSRVTFETNPTEQSAEYAELMDLVLVSLNRVAVELTLASQGIKRVNEDQVRVAVRLIHSACEVGTLLPSLIQEQSLRLPYGFPLARMYYERLLSAAYVLSDDGEAARRAILYSAFRAFKDQVRTLSAGGQTRVIPERTRISRKSPIVKEAITYFANGRAIQEFEHSRLQRTELIGRRSKEAGTLFHSIEQMGFSVSSEITHGSYYSTTLYSGAPRESTPEKDFNEATTTILSISVLSSEALGRLLIETLPEIVSAQLLIRSGMTFMSMEIPEAKEKIDLAYKSILKGD